MFRKFFFLCLFFFSLSNVSFAQKVEFTPDEIAGTYLISGNYGSNEIKLNKDGTYFSISTSDLCERNPNDPNDCLNYPTDSGNFTVEGNIVKFKVLKSRRADANNKVKNNSVQDYELMIVKWSERFYLIWKDSLKAFADAINLQTEPRKTTLVTRANYFFLRQEGVEKPVVGLPELPDGWNNFLLKNPVKATILKIEIKDGENFALINKGSDDGLKVGMQVMTDYIPTGSEIVSVKKLTAIVKIKTDSGRRLFLQTGDTVQTNYDNSWLLRLSPRRKK